MFELGFIVLESDALLLLVRACVLLLLRIPLLFFMRLKQSRILTLQVYTAGIMNALCCKNPIGRHREKNLVRFELEFCGRLLMFRACIFLILRIP